MKRKWRFFLGVFAALLLFGLSGCGREFDPAWRVVDFRVMSIKSDPITIKTGEPATLSALVGRVSGETVRYSWSWCPLRTSAQDGYACPIDSDNLGAMFGTQLPEGFDPSQLDFDLGTDETATFINAFPAPMLLDFCRGLQRQISESTDKGLANMAPAFDCKRGFEVSVRLEASSGDKHIVTAKRVMLWTGSEHINENPRFERFEIRPEEARDAQKVADRLSWVNAALPHDEQWVEISEEEGLEIVADVSFEIRALLDPESVQMWEPPAPVGSDRDKLDPERETIGYSWFTSLGDLSDAKGVFLEGENTLAQAGSTSVMITGADMQDCVRTDGVCEVKLWSVARDSRLGVDWIDRTLVVVE